MSLSDFLQENGVFEYEGHLQEISDQMSDFENIVKERNIKNVLEVGFNAGHSAEFFLKLGCESVLSFDNRYHHYVDLGKQYLDTTYPGKHTLVIGDSVSTIPSYETDKKYDLIFIDGSIEYETIKQDLENCKKFSSYTTIVVIDDTIYSDYATPWNEGFSRVWEEAVASGFVMEIKRYEYCQGRGMSVGFYDMMKK